MLKEVRLLANIQDLNVLRYYHSWIEFLTENSEEENDEYKNSQHILAKSTPIMENCESPSNHMKKYTVCIAPPPEEFESYF